MIAKIAFACGRADLKPPLSLARKPPSSMDVAGGE
jgi:hypothetical protein